MDGTKPCEFIGFGAMDGTKPYEFIRFWAGFGDNFQLAAFAVLTFAQRHILNFNCGSGPENGHETASELVPGVNCE